MGMVWAEIFVGTFLVLFPCGVGFLLDFFSPCGVLSRKLVGGSKKRWSDEMMVLPRGSARHVFFPVHKIGFCLSQPGDVLDGGGGWCSGVVGTLLLPFFCTGCTGHFLSFVFHQIDCLACESDTN